MSFDHLQARIRAMKSPVVAELDLRPEQLPPALLARHLEAGGETLRSAALAAEEYGRLLLDGLADVVPAVSFPVSSFELLGWRGMEVLEKLIACAKSKGLFVIADAQRSGLGPDAAACGAAWLGGTRVGGTRVGGTLCPVFDADCVTVNGYLGSDCLGTVLEASKAANKCAFVLVKTPNPSSVELEDMAAGDRQVCTVMGDLTRRIAKDAAGEKFGFYALGAIVGTDYPVEMKQLRRRWDRIFFLVPDCGTPEHMDVARHAFDEYGRGAAVCVRGPILDACRESADPASAARAAADDLRRQWQDLVTIL